MLLADLLLSGVLPCGVFVRLTVEVQEEDQEGTQYKVGKEEGRRIPGTFHIQVEIVVPPTRYSDHVQNELDDLNCSKIFLERKRSGNREEE